MILGLTKKEDRSLDLAMARINAGISIFNYSWKPKGRLYQKRNIDEMFSLSSMPPYVPHAMPANRIIQTEP